MKQKEILLEQMAACRNQKAWFVPLSDALNGLSPQQAAWRDGSENHSIRQIVNHLIFWNERWLMRLKGIEPPKVEGEISATFDSKTGDVEEWESTAMRLDEVLGGLESELRNASEEKLAGEAFKDAGDSWYAFLSQLTIHNAYHIGQIIYTRKLQGSWDAAQGVR
jgi:uncharacterized damage-inducible protein DinB